MTINTWFHGVQSIAVKEIECLRNEVTETDFYHRELVITLASGQRVNFKLFSDNGYNLLIDDNELESMRRDEIKKAA